MASVDLLVRIKAVGGKVLDNLTGSTERLNRQLDGTNHSIGEVDRNLKGASNSTSNTTKAFAKMSQGLGGLVRVYAVIAANIFAASAAFEALRRAARVEQLTQSMQAFGMVTGVAMQSLSQEMIKASGAALDFETSMRAAAAGTTAGFSSEQILGITKVATNASKVLGRDTADSIDRLTRGLAKLEPELIDELGLMTRVSEATSEYARANGKSVSQLTFFEKRMANAVLAEGTRKYDLLGNAIKANPFDQAAADISNIARSIASIAIGPISSLFSFLRENTFALYTTLGLIGVYFAKTLIPQGEGFGKALEDSAERASVRLSNFNKITIKREADKNLADPTTDVGQRAAQSKAGIEALKQQYQSLAASGVASVNAINRAWVLANQGVEGQTLALERLAAKRQIVENKGTSLENQQFDLTGTQMQTRGAGGRLGPNQLVAPGTTKTLKEINDLIDQRVLRLRNIPPSIRDAVVAARTELDTNRQNLDALTQTQQIVRDLALQKQIGAEAVTEAIQDAADVPVADRVLASEKERYDGLVRTNQASATLLDLNKKIGEASSIRELKDLWSQIPDLVEEYRERVEESGATTSDFSEGWLEVQLSSMLAGNMITQVAGAILKFAGWVGLIVSAFQLVWGVVKQIWEFFKSDSAKKFAEDVKKASESLEEYSKAAKEIRDNSIGADLLIQNLNIQEGIAQKANSFKEINEKTTAELEKQNRAYVFGQTLLERGKNTQEEIANLRIKENALYAKLVSIRRSSMPQEEMKAAFAETQRSLAEVQQRMKTLSDIKLNFIDRSSIESDLETLQENRAKILGEDITTNIALRVRGTDELERVQNQIKLTDEAVKVLQRNKIEFTVEADGNINIVTKLKQETAERLQQEVKDALNLGLDEVSVTNLNALNQEMIALKKSGTEALETFKNGFIPTTDIDTITASFNSLNVAVQGAKETLKNLQDDKGIVKYTEEVETAIGNVSGAQRTVLFNLGGVENLAANIKKLEGARSEITKINEALKTAPTDQQEALREELEEQQLLLQNAARMVYPEFETATENASNKLKEFQKNLIGIGLAKEGIDGVTNAFGKLIAGSAGQSGIQQALKDLDDLANRRAQFNQENTQYEVTIKKKQAGEDLTDDQVRQLGIFEATKASRETNLKLDEAISASNLKRANSLATVEQATARIALSQAKLNTEIEKYNGIVNESDRGAIKQLEFRNRAIELERKLKQQEVNRQAAEIAFAQSQTNAPPIVTKEQFDNLKKNNAIPELFDTAGNKIQIDTVEQLNAAYRTLGQDRAEATATYLRLIKETRVEEDALLGAQYANIQGQIAQRTEIVDLISTQGFKEGQLVPVSQQLLQLLSNQNVIYKESLDLISNRIDLERELLDLKVEQYTRELNNLEAVTTIRVAVQGDTFDSRQTIDELKALQQAKVNVFEAESTRTTETARGEVAKATAFLESAKKNFAADPKNEKFATELRNAGEAKIIAERRVANAEYKVQTDREKLNVDLYLERIEKYKEVIEFQNKSITNFNGLNDASKEVWYQIGQTFREDIEASMGFVEGAANVFTSAVDDTIDAFVDAVVEGGNVLENTGKALRESLVQSLGDLAKDSLKAGVKTAIVTTTEKVSPQLAAFLKGDEQRAREAAERTTAATESTAAAQAATGEGNKSDVGTKTAVETMAGTNHIEAMAKFDSMITLLQQIAMCSCSSDNRGNDILTGGAFKDILNDLPSTVADISSSSIDDLIKNPNIIFDGAAPKLDPKVDPKIISDEAEKQTGFLGGIFDKIGSLLGMTEEGNLQQAQGFGSLEGTLGSVISSFLVKLGGKDRATGGAVGSTLMSAGMASGNIYLIGAGAVSSLLGFEKGGIMTSSGPMPLNMYSKGGIARGPQLAMYGEGRTPEAYVPLPDGRSIPVSMDGGGASVNNIGITVNVSKDGSATTRMEGGPTEEEKAVMLGKSISAAVKMEIANQQRPGGLLARRR
jgi:plasmid maintenance system killer protein